MLVFSFYCENILECFWNLGMMLVWLQERAGMFIISIYENVLGMLLESFWNPGIVYIWLEDGKEVIWNHCVVVKMNWNRIGNETGINLSLLC